MNDKLVIITKNRSRTGLTQTLNAYPVNFENKDWEMLKQEMQKLGKLKFKIGGYSNSYEVEIKCNGADRSELLAQSLIKKGYTVKRLF